MTPDQAKALGLVLDGNALRPPGSDALVCTLGRSLDRELSRIADEIIALRTALKSVAEFPITNPSENMDASNMAMIAKSWLPLPPSVKP